MAGLHGLHPKQLARIGIFYLEEAVLDVLLEAKYEQELLWPAEICQRADMTYVLYESGDMAYGVLAKLEVEGRIEHSQEGRRQWQLTEKEFEKRRKDL